MSAETVQVCIATAIIHAHPYSKESGVSSICYAKGSLFWNNWESLTYTPLPKNRLIFLHVSSLPRKRIYRKMDLFQGMECIWWTVMHSCQRATAYDMNHITLSRGVWLLGSSCFYAVSSGSCMLLQWQPWFFLFGFLTGPCNKNHPFVDSKEEDLGPFPFFDGTKELFLLQTPVRPP